VSQSSAYEYALKLLNARSYTARSLLRKLTQKGIPPEDAQAVLDRLEASGLVNDAKYAQQYARTKVLMSGASKRRVVQDLRRKGIAQRVADDAIAAVFADEEIDPAALAEKTARKKLKQMGDLEPLVLRRRLFGFLARRGYELEDIKRAVEKVLP
jgi:regulatory protein